MPPPYTRWCSARLRELHAVPASTRTPISSITYPTFAPRRRERQQHRQTRQPPDGSNGLGDASSDRLLTGAHLPGLGRRSCHRPTWGCATRKPRPPAGLALALCPALPQWWLPTVWVAEFGHREFVWSFASCCIHRNKQRGNAHAGGRVGPARTDKEDDMKRNLAMAALALALAAVPAGAGEVFVRFGPPPPPMEMMGMRPSPRHMYTGGYYRWTGRHYKWVRGRWVKPPRPHAVWAPGHWERHRRGHMWIAGYWRY